MTAMEAMRRAMADWWTGLVIVLIVAVIAAVVVGFWLGFRLAIDWLFGTILRAVFGGFSRDGRRKGV